MNAKIQKLQNQFTESKADEVQQISSMFSGISIFVNGYTSKCMLFELCNSIIFFILKFHPINCNTDICSFFLNHMIHVHITDPTSDELKRLMQAHGGVFHHYYNRQLVTHIIATNLPNNKIINIGEKKVVKPEWITER